MPAAGVRERPRHQPADVRPPRGASDRTDGSYIGRATPTVEATTHSLLHGRVLIQYRPGLPEAEVHALDQLVKDDPDRVVGFANQTSMAAPVAATAYLSLLTCPRVTAGTLHALRVFRDRRRGFGSAF
jgi:hypothetical protein